LYDTICAGEIMANEYVLLKQKEDLGMIAITKHAFELITTFSIEDDEDVVLHTSKFSRPVTVKLSNNKLHIKVDVNVKYGKNVNTVIDRLQEKIAKSIFNMTDYQSSSVDINVVGFVF
jgi:uncharacterized alkaline shock family protein YloU